MKKIGVLALVLAAVVSASALAGQFGEGNELDFGGPGSGPGQFLEIRDLAFDAQNNPYVLDGARYDKNKPVFGNLRVQKFDQSGKVPARIFSERRGARREE